MKHRYIVVLFLAVVVLASAPDRSLAASTRIWTGTGADTAWSTAANWNGGISLPAGGDSLVFPIGPTPAQRTMNHNLATTNFNALTFGTNGYSLSGGWLRLDGGILATNRSGANTVNVPIVLRFRQPFSNAFPNSLLVFNNTVEHLQSASTPDLEIQGAGTTTFNGPLVTHNVTNAEVRMLGSGRLNLAGYAAQAGGFILSNGLLVVSGAYPNHSVRLGGGTLGGHGDVGKVVMSGPATLDPGDNGPAILHVNGDLLLAYPGTLRMQILGTMVGADYDQVNVIAGRVELNQCHLEISSPGTPAGGSYMLIRNDGTDAVSGTFVNRTEDAIFPSGDIWMRITYRGGDGNDVELIAPAVWDDDSGGGKLWSSAINWVGDVVPPSASDLLFGIAATLKVVTNDLAAGRLYGAVSFMPVSGPNAVGYSVFGNSIRVAAGLNASGGVAGGSEVIHALHLPVTLAASQSFRMGEKTRVRMSNVLDVAGYSLELEPASGFGFGGILEPAHSVTGTASGRIRVRTGAALEFVRPLVNALSVPVTVQGGVARNFMAWFINSPDWTLTSGSVELSGGCIPALAASGASTLAIRAPAAMARDLSLADPVTLRFTDSSAVLSVTGNVAVAGARLALEDFGATDIGRTFVLLRKESPGPINGTFAGLPEGGILRAASIGDTPCGGFLCRVSYVGGDGNDLVVTLLPPIPTGNTRVWAGTTEDAYNGLNWAMALDLPPRIGDRLRFPSEGFNFVEKSIVVTNVLTCGDVWWWPEDAFPGFAYGVDRIEFTGDGYALRMRDAPLVLVNGILAGQSNGVNVIQAFLGSGGSYNSGGCHVVQSQSWTVSSPSATLEVQAFLIGPGGIVKDGPGTLRFWGHMLNDGGILLEEGMLTLGTAMVAFTPIQVQGGTLDCDRLLFVRGTTLSAMAGTVRVNHGTSDRIQLDSWPGLGGAMILGPASTFHVVLGGPSSFDPSATAVRMLGTTTLDLGGATLAVTLNDEVQRGAAFVLVRADATSQINGTFAGLPQGTITRFGSRYFRIEYTAVQVALVALDAYTELLRPVRTGDGRMRIAGSGPAGAVMVIEASANLESWQAIGTTTVQPDGTYAFVDPAAQTESQRFYRSREQ